MLKSTSFKFIFCFVLLTALSGCEFYVYTTKLCNSSNALSMAHLNGAYGYHKHIVEGQVLSEAHSPVNIRGTAEGELSIVFPNNPATTFSVCTVGGVILAEGRPDDTTSQMAGNFAMFLDQVSSNEIRLVGMKMTLAEVEKVFTVEKSQDKVDAGTPMTLLTYIVDNSVGQPEAIVPFFQRSDEFVLTYKRN